MAKIKENLEKTFQKEKQIMQELYAGTHETLVVKAMVTVVASQ